MPLGLQFNKKQVYGTAKLIVLVFYSPSHIFPINWPFFLKQADGANS